MKRRDSFPYCRPEEKQKNQKIAKVAAGLFGIKGYLETSMDDIAAAAKVTKGGVYHYFRSKTEILYFICSTYVDGSGKPRKVVGGHRGGR